MEGKLETPEESITKHLRKRRLERMKYYSVKIPILSYSNDAVFQKQIIVHSAQWPTKEQILGVANQQHEIESQLDLYLGEWQEVIDVISKNNWIEFYEGLCIASKQIDVTSNFKGHLEIKEIPIWVV